MYGTKRLKEITTYNPKWYIPNEKFQRPEEIKTFIRNSNVTLAKCSNVSYINITYAHLVVTTEGESNEGS